MLKFVCMSHYREGEVTFNSIFFIQFHIILNASQHVWSHILIWIRSLLYALLGNAHYHDIYYI